LPVSARMFFSLTASLAITETLVFILLFYDCSRLIRP
jgi:hypothetical protein